MKMWVISIRFVLSALLVISTGGFATYAHFCKGEMVSSSVFIPADPCSSGSCAMSQAKENQHGQHAKKNCCEDDFLFLQTTPVKDEETQAQTALLPKVIHRKVIDELFFVPRINVSSSAFIIENLFLRHQNFRL